MSKILTWNQSHQPHFLTELQQFCTDLSTFKKCNYYWLNPVYCKELLDNICFFGVLHSMESSMLVGWWTLSDTVKLWRTIRTSLRSYQWLLRNFMGYAALQRMAEILQTQAMKTKTHNICYPKIENIYHKNRARESQPSQRRFSHAIQSGQKVVFWGRMLLSIQLFSQIVNACFFNQLCSCWKC